MLVKNLVKQKKMVTFDRRTHSTGYMIFNFQVTQKSISEKET